MSDYWFAWHDNYQRNRGLQARLSLVCDYIAESLNAFPPGPIRVVSICAGDGRDLMSAMIGHPRAADVHARLIEEDRRLVEAGQSSADFSELGHQLKFVQGDATIYPAYQGAVPAEVVLVCGVFGHVREEHLAELIQGLPALCSPNARVIWTRSVKAWDGERHVGLIRQYFQAAGFDEVKFEVTAVGASGVGCHRYTGPAVSLPNQRQFFTFSGSEFDRTEVNA